MTTACENALARVAKTQPTRSRKLLPNISLIEVGEIGEIDPDLICALLFDKSEFH